MRRFYYSLAYLFFLGLPAFLLHIFFVEQFNWKALIVTTLVSLFVGGIFDIWGTRQNLNDRFFVWDYDSKSILGFKILGVPVEDFFFFLVLTPFLLVTVYEASYQLVRSDINFSWVIAALLVMIIIGYFVSYFYAIKTKKKDSN